MQKSRTLVAALLRLSARRRNDRSPDIRDRAQLSSQPRRRALEPGRAPARAAGRRDSSPAGHPLRRSARGHRSRRPDGVTAGSHQANADVHREFPIFHMNRGAEQTLGVLSIEATLDDVYRRLFDTAIVILIGQGAKTFVVSFFILYIVNRLITRHLVTAAKFLGGYDLRRSPPPLRLERRPLQQVDELDQLVGAFNGMCVENSRLYRDLEDREYTLQHQRNELRTLANRLMYAQDDERRRIATMLHETTAQDLAALKMLLARLNRTAVGLSDDERGALTESISLAEQSMTEIRTVSYLLHPPFLDEVGLLSALRWYAGGFAKRSGIQVHLDLPETLERLPLDTETV